MCARLLSLVWASRMPLGPQWLCLVPGEIGFSRDGMVLPFLESQSSGEDPRLCQMCSFFSNARAVGRFTDERPLVQWDNAHEVWDLVAWFV